MVEQGTRNARRIKRRRPVGATFEFEWPVVSWQNDSSFKAASGVSNVFQFNHRTTPSGKHCGWLLGLQNIWGLA
jgi:hypothetical protein